MKYQLVLQLQLAALEREFEKLRDRFIKSLGIPKDNQYLTKDNNYPK